MIKLVHYQPLAHSVVDNELSSLHTRDMGTTRIVLTTIGYEGANLTDFIATLQEAGISRLIDVRELPMSRRKGFAKQALSEALAGAGIEYVHLRGLGDPKEGREAARAGNFVEFVRVFNNHMRSEIAQTDLKRAIGLVAQGGACLMCYERNHAACHRSIVAKAISDSVKGTIRNLGVREGLGRHYERNARLELVVEARV